MGSGRVYEDVEMLRMRIEVLSLIGLAAKEEFTFSAKVKVAAYERMNVAARALPLQYEVIKIIAMQTLIFFIFTPVNHLLPT